MDGDAVSLRGICLIKTSITINLIKIIHTQIIFRAFIFHNIMRPENPSDIFPDRNISFFFYDQHIDFLWFCTQLMFVFKEQQICLCFQFNLNPGIKGRMPLQGMRLLFPFFHIKPPFLVIDAGGF